MDLVPVAEMQAFGFNDVWVKFQEVHPPLR